MAKPQISLRVSVSDRLKYAMGGRPFKFGVATILVLALGGGLAWQGPTIWNGFLDLTGLQSEEVVAEREARAVELSRLEDSIAAAQERKAPEKPTEEVKEAWSKFTSEISKSHEIAKSGQATSADIAHQHGVLKKAGKTLDDAINEQVAEEKKAAEKAAKEKAEKEAAEAQKAAEAKAKQEAEETARREAERQQTQPWTPPQETYTPPSTNNDGGGGGGGGGTATASTSMTVSCPRPTSVTVTATGGGTVTVSGGGASNSGAGSASVTVTINGSMGFSGTGQGSIGLSATAC